VSLLLSYYGDDFTGSADVMEALSLHGVGTVLFTRPPSDAEFQPFVDYRAIGLAGTSRSQTPAWMDAHLPGAFRWLKSLGAAFCHYKVCSTFDSSPAVGSIGRAIDLAMAMFGQTGVALILGAPQIKRYTFAGHLFAAYQGAVYRIDRHPVMRVHPVTPMAEADVLVHLAGQTNQVVTLFDVHDGPSQLQAGERLLQLDGEMRPFVVGSSGVEYALMAAMVARGNLSERPKFNSLPAVERCMVVSGSVSPTTERQIRFALANDFVGIAVDPCELATFDNGTVIARTIALAMAALQKGLSPIVYTALGRDTDSSARLLEMSDGRQRIGEALGVILQLCVAQDGLTRVMIAGGDTASHALGALDIYALTLGFPLVQTPGSPLCIGHRRKGPPLEIAMKGGQVGYDNYFVALRDGIDLA
jgi:3-oxoisoapionate kinase